MLPESPPQNRLIFPTPEIFPPDLAPFWQLWQQEKFWACHEALEDVWRIEKNTNRRQFLQGLVHLSAALFQHRRGNAIGCARQMVRAKVRLEVFFPVFENLEIEKMLRAVESEVRESLEKEHRGLEELAEQVRRKL